MGIPCIVAMGLPGKREEFIRAGIIAIVCINSPKAISTSILKIGFYFKNNVVLLIQC
jgi:hypothetical protein